MRFFARHDTAAAQPADATADLCCVLGCGALADSDAQYIHAVSNDDVTPPIHDLALRLPLCQTHARDYDRYLDGDTDNDELPAGLFDGLLTCIGETLRDEAPDALALVARVMYDWLAANYPARLKPPKGTAAPAPEPVHSSSLSAPGSLRASARRVPLAGTRAYTT